MTPLLPPSRQLELFWVARKKLLPFMSMDHRKNVISEWYFCIYERAQGCREIIICTGRWVPKSVCSNAFPRSELSDLFVQIASWREHFSPPDPAKQRQIVNQLSILLSQTVAIWNSCVDISTVAYCKVDGTTKFCPWISGASCSLCFTDAILKKVLKGLSSQKAVLVITDNHTTILHTNSCGVEFMPSPNKMLLLQITWCYHCNYAGFLFFPSMAHAQFSRAITINVGACLCACV